MEEHAETDKRLLQVIRPMLSKYGWTANELASLIGEPPDKIEALLISPSRAEFLLVKKLLSVLGFQIIVTLSPTTTGPVELS